MKLYVTFTSPYARLARIVVAEKGPICPPLVTDRSIRTARDRGWARGSQGSASPWDRLWASYPHPGAYYADQPDGTRCRQR